MAVTASRKLQEALGWTAQSFGVVPFGAPQTVRTWTVSRVWYQSCGQRWSVLSDWINCSSCCSVMVASRCRRSWSSDRPSALHIASTAARRDAVPERLGYRVVRLEAKLVVKDLASAVALVRVALAEFAKT